MFKRMQTSHEQPSCESITKHHAFTPPSEANEVAVMFSIKVFLEGSGEIQHTQLADLRGRMYRAIDS